MALTHWASEGDANTHLDKGQWTGRRMVRGWGVRGEIAAGMMCCGLAGKRRRRRERRLGRGEQGGRGGGLPVLFCLFYSTLEKEHIGRSTVSNHIQYLMFVEC